MTRHRYVYTEAENKGEQGTERSNEEDVRVLEGNNYDIVAGKGTDTTEVGCDSS